jgi:sugar lactone lactonase YvrE
MPATAADQDRQGRQGLHVRRQHERTIGLATTKVAIGGSRTSLASGAVSDAHDACEQIDGLPIVAPNDIVADTKGGMYFTDTLNSRFRPTPAARTKPWIVYIRPDGKAVKASEEVERPNGISLSPDGRVLYAANGPIISAFDVQPDGSLRNFRTFATLMGGNADSMCVDADGRLYVAAGGVQVFSPKGEYLGTITTPLNPQAPAFAGPDKKTLYVVGGGAVYKIAMAQGVRDAPVIGIARHIRSRICVSLPSVTGVAAALVGGFILGESAKPIKVGSQRRPRCCRIQRRLT